MKENIVVNARSIRRSKSSKKDIKDAILVEQRTKDTKKINQKQQGNTREPQKQNTELITLKR